MRRLALALFFFLFVTVPAAATAQWMILPATPTLPHATKSGLVPVNGIRIWYAEFGSGEPAVLLLHGGLANADYWGHQVPPLARHYRVIVMDSRGHGRSSRDTRPFGYDLMASDVLGLLDHLHVRKAALVGWSDGAIIGLDIAIHHPERLTKLFAFAANSDPGGVKDVSRSPTFMAFEARAGREYAALSPTPRDYKTFLAQITRMWDTEPHFSDAQLGTIRVPVWIVDADHDEAIKRENTLYMVDHIPNACLLIEPGVSHFSFLQDSEQFTGDVEHFLVRAETCRAGS